MISFYFVSLHASHLTCNLAETDAARTVVNSSESLTGISGNKNLYFGGDSAQFQALSSSDFGM